MNIYRRIFKRFFLIALSLLGIAFVINQIVDRDDDRIPAFITFTLAYFLIAYLILPRVIHITLTLFRRGRIPRFTRAHDALPADPVNIILVGSEKELKHAFQKAGWEEADPLNLRTSWKMTITFLRNKPYPRAPFSSLFLFGRKQDHGFQLAIGNSPRKRHHIRFWGVNLNPDVDWTDIHYWITKHTVNPSKPLMWVGSATKDLGIGLARLTYQITHTTDKNVDQERAFVLSSLRDAGLIAKEQIFESGDFMVGKYSSDGKIIMAHLKSE